MLKQSNFGYWPWLRYFLKEKVTVIMIKQNKDKKYFVACLTFCVWDMP